MIQTEKLVLNLESAIARASIDLALLGIVSSGGVESLVTVLTRLNDIYTQYYEVDDDIFDRELENIKKEFPWLNNEMVYGEWRDDKTPALTIVFAYLRGKEDPYQSSRPGRNNAR